MSRFVMTIDSDDEVPTHHDDSDDDMVWVTHTHTHTHTHQVAKRSKKEGKKAAKASKAAAVAAAAAGGDGDLNPDFVFDEDTAPSTSMWIPTEMLHPEDAVRSP